MREKLKGLLKRIDALQAAEAKNAFLQDNFKVIQLQTNYIQQNSYNECFAIYSEIQVLYQQSGHLDKIPDFDNNNLFDEEFLRFLKMHACYAVYLYAKLLPAENENLEYYLIKAKENGFIDVKFIEIYKTHHDIIASANDASNVDKLYKDCNADLKKQYLFFTPYGRFLDLLNMVHAHQLIQDKFPNQFRLLALFKRKIEAGLKLFIKECATPKAAEEVDRIFTAGIMQPAFISRQSFIEYVKQILTSPASIQQTVRVQNGCNY